MDKQTNGLKDIPLYHFDKHYGPRDGPKDRGTDVPSYGDATAASKISPSTGSKIDDLFYPIQKRFDGNGFHSADSSRRGAEAAFDGRRCGAESVGLADQKRNSRHVGEQQSQRLARDGGGRQDGAGRSRDGRRTYLTEQVSERDRECP